MSTARKRPPSPPGGCPPRAGKLPKPKTLAEVVDFYKKCFRQHHDEDRLWFANQPSFEMTLEMSVLSQARGRNGKTKRHDHQRRISKDVLEEALELLRQQNLNSCESFEDLHDKIETTAGEISGIGDLAVYDFALRIGSRLNKLPKLVYLHSGAREGAKALGRKGHTIQIEDLPEAFHDLDAHYVEDCLCIFKDDLKRIGPRR